MKDLLRLYPRSWRRRYGREMEVLLDEMPGDVGVALDLVLGAAGAYAAVVRGNRVLSAAGSFLNAVCIAVLLQAIAYVLFIMLAHGTPVPKFVALGPIALTAFSYPCLLTLGGSASLLAGGAGLEWVSGTAVLVVLLGALYLVLMVPRWAERLASERR